jgi:hypothetical protein
VRSCRPGFRLDLGQGQEAGPEPVELLGRDPLGQEAVDVADGGSNPIGGGLAPFR